MRRSLWTILGFALALFCSAPQELLAHEPDGRAALRYEWAPGGGGGATRSLRLSVTAIVPLGEAKLDATIPASTLVSVRSLQSAGAVAPDFGAPGPWRAGGLAIGDVAAGATIVLDLDVLEPSEGGGILEFALDFTVDGKAVREVLGVPVGTPGIAPTIRNGAAEFPAQIEKPTP